MKTTSMDGFRWMAIKQAEGFDRIPVWGEGEWDLGCWPQSCVMWQERSNGGYSIAVYLEGAIETIYQPSREAAVAWIDGFAFDSWNLTGKGPADIERYLDVDSLPASHRGEPR